jgi:hypothetical protein
LWQVTVSPFFIGKHEVSNARFKAFVEATGYVTEAEKFGNSFVVEQFISKKVSEGISSAVVRLPRWPTPPRAELITFPLKLNCASTCLGRRAVVAARQRLRLAAPRGPGHKYHGADGPPRHSRLLERRVGKIITLAV